ncbi:MAG: trypsin-like peptidase domain-containing protein [Phycisphaerae bacterium]
MTLHSPPRPLTRLLPAALILCASALCSQVHAENVILDPAKSKGSDTLRNVFAELTARGNQSTVLVDALMIEGGKDLAQVALGTVVGTDGADGYVLTKASEVAGRKQLTVVLGKEKLPAKLVGVSEPLDLAMLRVPAGKEGLWTPVEWADTNERQVQVGQWVATCGPMDILKKEPVAVGVVSVGRRRIPGHSGFLGVMMANTPDGSGAAVKQVLTGSAAEAAHLNVGDVIIAVAGKPIHNGVELREQVGSFRPGDVIMLSVKRAKAEVVEEVQVTLGVGLEEQAEEPPEFSMERLLGGVVSKRSSDFASVFQHDTVIRPQDCGGPIVDLTGKVIGINIARAGRTETYALPADLVVPMLKPLESGKLAPVNANAAATRPKQTNGN